MILSYLVTAPVMMARINFEVVRWLHVIYPFVSTASTSDFYVLEIPHVREARISALGNSYSGRWIEMTQVGKETVWGSAALSAVEKDVLWEWRGRSIISRYSLTICQSGKWRKSRKKKKQTRMNWKSRRRPVWLNISEFNEM